MHAITGGAAFCGRLETPIAEADRCHVQDQVALQLTTMKPRQPTGRFDLQCRLRRRR
jgi:hypothetical protein